MKAMIIHFTTDISILKNKLIVIYASRIVLHFTMFTLG